MFFLVLGLVQGLAAGADRHLPSYLTVLSGYAGETRAAARREIRAWPRAEITAVLFDFYARSRDLRAVPTAASDIDFRLAEAAVLLHAEVGLQYFQAAAWNDGAWHLMRSREVLEWSRAAARDLRAWAEERRDRQGRGARGPLAHHLDVRERIVPREFYVALAASALVFGQSGIARDFAERAIAAAPHDAEAHLVLGAVAEYVAGEVVLRDDRSLASPLRKRAESAFKKAIALDPGLVEARLRLGHLLLSDGRLDDAEAVLVEAEARARAERLHYLARLFLGRAADRQGRPGDAAEWYRRAVEVMPSAQAAHLALGHALEKEAGPSVAHAHVAASLEASRQHDRPADPFWLYPFGPPGLAQSTLDRLFAVLDP